MITNNGKAILAKYLIGQAPAYASYIAVGCGPRPLSVSATVEQKAEFLEKDNLDFEMFRVPITSRGYVTESGTSKIVLTAELPTQSRYEISEVGVFSEGTNPAAGSTDSKLLYSFSDTENWEYHVGLLANPLTAYPITVGDDSAPYDIVKTDGAFLTDADNKAFTSSARVERYEIPRFLNSSILMQGDSSDLAWDGTNLTDTGSHIHIDGANLALQKNSPKDELRVAFSVMNKVASSGTLPVPQSARILVEFASSDTDIRESARAEIIVDDISSVDPNTQKQDFTNDRYVVVSTKLEDLVRSSGFTWPGMTVVKVSACVYYEDAPSSEFFIALDALRLENVSSLNPLYGMTGYSRIQSTSGLPIVKYENTSNYIEFRFAVGVA
tara:strand:+ start:4625 stop:5773 length:1149 start_codon:yes stop_codon:yes gene_type:complete